VWLPSTTANREDGAVEPEAPHGDVVLPRAQLGTNSQLRLSGLLADYTFEATRGLSSASIVRMLAEFGISASGARTALSRVAKRGLLQPMRGPDGVRYVISEASRRTHAERLRRVVHFGAAPREWDGVWTVVAFSVAERDRSRRARLRLALEKALLAPMTDAVWVSPWDVVEEVRAAALEAAANTSILRATEAAEGTGMRPLDAFDLPSVRALYEEYIADFEPIAQAADAGALPPADALISRTESVRRWRHIGLSDPDLPAVLLPDDWPQRRAYGVFSRVWRGLAPLALLRVKDLVRDNDPETAEQLDWLDV